MSNKAVSKKGEYMLVTPLLISIYLFITLTAVVGELLNISVYLMLNAISTLAGCCHSKLHISTFIKQHISTYKLLPPLLGL